MRKLLLVDKDGTLVRPKSGKEFVQNHKDQELLPKVAETIAHYRAEGWWINIISNQGGVALGYKSLEDTIQEMQFCLELLPDIDSAYFCPDDGETCFSVSSGRIQRMGDVEKETKKGETRFRLLTKNCFDYTTHP
jgi:D-glycero-D-manno-heptose 1,7-bisphosphate phosphatase